MWKAKIKKYWKIALILLAAGFILLYFIFIKRKDIQAIDPENAVNKLHDGIQEVKEQIEEASNVAVVEVVVAKKELIEVKKELNEVSKIKDKTERRSRLSELAKRSNNY